MGRDQIVTKDWLTNQHDMTFFTQASNKASEAVAAETKNDDDADD